MKDFDFNTWWKGLPVIAKAAFIALAIYIVLTIHSALKEFKFTLGKQSTLAGYMSQGQQPSFPDSVYRNLADDLERAMRGAGTNEQLIFTTIGKLKNDVDAIKLNKAFGMRSSWGISYSLREWLEGDLSSKDLQKVWQIMDFNGITYRF